jgi:hypothetical protein
MRKFLVPVIVIPLSFGLCGFTTLALPSNSGIQVIAAIYLFVLLALYIGVFVHEAGHAIGAMLARFQIIHFIVGPLLIAAKTGGGYKLLPNKDSSFWGGLILALPTNFDNLRRRLMSFVSGGPIANIVFGLVFAVLAAGVWENWKTNIPEGLSTSNFNLWSFGCLLGIIGWMSISLFIVNVLPIRTKILPSDGLQILRLLKGGDVAQRSASFAILSALLRLRERPAALPAHLVKDLLAVKDNSADEAEAFIDRINQLYRRRKVSSLSLSIMAHWIAFYEAIHRENVAEARRWLDEGNSRSRAEATLLYHMANASVLFLEGKNQLAIEHAEKWATAWRQQIQVGGGIVLFFKEQMEKVTKKHIVVIKALLDEKNG